MLRVIAGKYRGRKIDQPDSNVTRPTTDRTKEAVFSMLQFEIPDSIFLDLYSGSGSIAIEASSRGAMKVIAVENDFSAINVIRGNVDRLKINNISIVKSNVDSFLERMKGTKFDFIYIDPPYDENLYNNTLNLIKINRILNSEGLVIVETSKPNEMELPNGFVIRKKKKYGKTWIIVIGNNI